MIAIPDIRAMLATAVAEARQGLAEGGIPIGAALYRDDGAAFVPPGGVRVSVGGGQPDAVSLRLGAPVPVETVVRLEGAEVALEP